MFVGGVIFKFFGCFVLWIAKGFRVPFKKIWDINISDDLADNAAYETTLKVIGVIVVVIIAILLGTIKFKE